MRTETITTGATFIPTSYDGSSTFPSGNVQNSANGLNGSDNTSAQVRFTTTSTTYYAIYNFSVSEIPVLIHITYINTEKRRLFTNFYQLDNRKFNINIRLLQIS
jgi:hypothetical protein